MFFRCKMFHSLGPAAWQTTDLRQLQIATVGRHIHTRSKGRRLMYTEELSDLVKTATSTNFICEQWQTKNVWQNGHATAHGSKNRKREIDQPSVSNSTAAGQRIGLKWRGGSFISAAWATWRWHRDRSRLISAAKIAVICLFVCRVAAEFDYAAVSNRHSVGLKLLLHWNRMQLHDSLYRRPQSRFLVPFHTITSKDWKNLLDMTLHRPYGPWSTLVWLWSKRSNKGQGHVLGKILGKRVTACWVLLNFYNSTSLQWRPQSSVYVSIRQYKRASERLTVFCDATTRRTGEWDLRQITASLCRARRLATLDCVCS